MNFNFRDELTTKENNEIDSKTRLSQKEEKAKELMSLSEQIETVVTIHEQVIEIKRILILFKII